MSYKVQKPSWQVSWADPPEIKKMKKLECDQKEWKNPSPSTDNTQINNAFFILRLPWARARKIFVESYDTVKLLLHLCVGKCLDLFFALDSSSTGSDVPAPSLSLGEESPSCGNGKSSQRPTRVTHLSKSLPDTQILKFPNTGCFFTGPPLKVLSVRLHSKSQRKKCQNFLRVWHSVIFRADQ